MKVGLIIYGSLDTLSGGYLYDRQLVAALEKSGAQVDIISLPERGYLRHLGDNFSGYLFEHIQSSLPDILLEDELNHPSLFAWNHHLRSKIKIPILSIVHHLRSREAYPGWQQRFYRRIERSYLRSLDGCIYNSQTTRQAVEDLAGFVTPGIVAYPGGDRLHPGVNTMDVVKRSHEPGPLHLVFLGNLIPRKGLHVLIDAVARLPRGTVQVEIVGSQQMNPAYARQMQQQVQQAEIQSEVIFRGAIPDDELQRVLQDSQALVLPSSYEGFGIAYLEAMGFGLPVIATRSGAAPEIITPGEQGFLIEPGDAAGLADCLQSWITDRQQLEAMSLSALARYRSHPTWDETCMKIIKFIGEFQPMKY